MGSLWKDIITQPTGRTFEVGLWAALKAYREEGVARDKDMGQLVGFFTSTRKRNRVTGKVQEENVTSYKSGIGRGDTPKGGDARVPVEVWNKRLWGYWIIQEESYLYILREGMLR